MKKGRQAQFKSIRSCQLFPLAHPFKAVLALALAFSAPWGTIQAQDGADAGFTAIAEWAASSDLASFPYRAGGALLEAEYRRGPLRLRLEGGARLRGDERGAQVRAIVRDAYVSYGSPRFEGRFGMQTLGWGMDGEGAVARHFARGDVRDFVMPDAEWIAMGIPAGRFQWFRGRHYAEVYASPAVWSSPLPSGDSPWFPASITPQVTLLPESAGSALAGWDGARWQANGAVRLALRPRGNLQGDLVAGYVPAPAASFGFRPAAYSGTGPLPVRLIRRAPMEWVFGVSAEASLAGGWLVSTDHLYRPDAAVTELPVAASELRQSLGNPQALLALGQMFTPQEGDYLSATATSTHDAAVRKALGVWTFDARARLEWLHNPAEGIPQKPLFWTFTADLSRPALRELLRLELEADWHADPFDWRLSPRAEWQHRDAWKLQAGAHLFGGRDPGDPLYAHLSYHTFRDADVVYVRLHLYVL